MTIIKLKNKNKYEGTFHVLTLKQVQVLLWYLSTYLPTTIVGIPYNGLKDVTSYLEVLEDVMTNSTKKSTIFIRFIKQ